MKTLFNEHLLDREHGSALLHVGSVREWAKSKGLHLNQTQPIDGYEFVQVECLVVALARQAEDLTPEQAREIVLADPVLKNNPRFLNYPNDIDPVFCKWLLGGDANVRWRAVLNSALAAHELVLLDFGSKLPIAAPPAQTVETAAPPLDFSVLATRDELIAAFGRFTGMDRTWFDNVGDTPALKAARKVEGVGARGRTKVPRFCPFEVTVWMADKNRKKGHQFHNENTPWELLEKHFPAAYEAHLRDDPREYRPG